jgi:hypothetical protein
MQGNDIKTIAKENPNRYRRSQILWHLIGLLNHAWNIESYDWLSITKKLELTIVFEWTTNHIDVVSKKKEFYLIDLFDDNECLVGFCREHDNKVVFKNALIYNNVDKIFRTTVGCDIPIPIWSV